MDNYGTWLPVMIVATLALFGMAIPPCLRMPSSPQSRRRHNVPKTDFDIAIRGLMHTARQQLKSHRSCYLFNMLPSLRSNLPKLPLTDTGTSKRLPSMANHVHIVVGVLNDPDPDTILRDFKSYASRKLNLKLETRPMQDGGPNQARAESLLTLNNYEC